MSTCTLAYCIRISDLPDQLTIVTWYSIGLWPMAPSHLQSKIWWVVASTLSGTYLLSLYLYTPHVHLFWRGPYFLLLLWSTWFAWGSTYFKIFGTGTIVWLGIQSHDLCPVNSFLYILSFHHPCIEACNSLPSMLPVRILCCPCKQILQAIHAAHS